MMNDPKKSDLVKVAMRPMNNAGLGTAAESVERRTRAKGSTGQQSTHRTQCRVRVSQALERVRQAAKLRKEEKFTALLHHINVDLLRLSFYALKRRAAPGVDGVTWLDTPVVLPASLPGHSYRVRGRFVKPIPVRVRMKEIFELSFDLPAQGPRALLHPSGR
jgi:RNA-directed DNA polymerase